MGKFDIDPFTPRQSHARVKPLVVEKVKEQTPAPPHCPRCGAKMKLAKITSKPDERPKLTASCPDCK
jgi:hypothetical protein